MKKVKSKKVENFEKVAPKVKKVVKEVEEVIVELKPEQKIKEG